jgi:hypothetical protein
MSMVKVNLCIGLPEVLEALHLARRRTKLRRHHRDTQVHSPEARPGCDSSTEVGGT